MKRTYDYRLTNLPDLKRQEKKKEKTKETVQIKELIAQMDYCEHESHWVPNENKRSFFLKTARLLRKYAFLTSGRLEVSMEGNFGKLTW